MREEMKSRLDGKEQMLTQIAKILGRQAHSQFVPEPLTPFFWQLAQLEAGELAGQLMEEVKNVGGQAVQVNSEVELKEYLESLLPASLRTPVALSDGEALGRFGIRKWLASSGRRIVPTLKEFIVDKLQLEPGEETATLVERYKALLMEASVGITTADFALADTGTLVIVSGTEQHRLMSLLPPVHICLLDAARILPSLTDLLANLRDRFSEAESAPKNLTCITGPSRTADIEQTITMGVHGPRSLHLILY
jgi:L-lactate dehydrogenase complex protein LldG